MYSRAPPPKCQGFTMQLRGDSRHKQTRLLYAKYPGEICAGSETKRLAWGCGTTVKYESHPGKVLARAKTSTKLRIIALGNVKREFQKRLAIIKGLT